MHTAYTYPVCIRTWRCLLSVRHGLLTLLAEGPSYGYALRSRLEARTGGTWPLNIGQVYTTLARLQRDGLVEPAGEDEDGHATYRITVGGQQSVEAWFTSPVARSAPARDELAIKLALAVGSPLADVRDVVQVQRTATMRALQEYTRLKARASGDAGSTDDLAWLLVLDSLVFQAEAEIRWLDHCETRLARSAIARRPAAHPSAPGGGTAPCTAPVGDASSEGARR